MKEISLKVESKKAEGASPIEMPRERYPSFTVYDDVPKELLKSPIGKVCTAKLKLTSKSIHEGEYPNDSVGFDVLSVIIEEDTDYARDKGKEIADTIIKKKGGE